MSDRRSVPGVTATPAARAAIARLREDRGPLLLMQSAGCCDGSAPMCFPLGEFVVGDGDILLGHVLDCPVYLEARHLAAWPHGELVLDIEPGFADGFSLDAGEGMHFVMRESAALACPRRSEPTEPPGTPPPSTPQ
ncbi:conserved hypothetical protein [Frankia sp. Hr75.2]|nr:conserved hypothetical protein [Frankia sp. Hr75.2]